MTDENKPESHCEMSGPAYRMQCMATGRSFEYGGEMIDQDWRSIPILRHQGIGVSDTKAEHAVTHTYPYHAAVALACWFMNEVGYRAKVRLVKYKMIVKHELWKEGELELEDAISFLLKRATKETVTPVDGGGEHG